nr:uncharacterized protein LOC127345418 [Lolium perenne]
MLFANTQGCICTQTWKEQLNERSSQQRIIKSLISALAPYGPGSIRRQWDGPRSLAPRVRLSPTRGNRMSRRLEPPSAQLVPSSPLASHTGIRMCRCCSASSSSASKGGAREQDRLGIAAPGDKASMMAT